MLQEGSKQAGAVDVALIQAERQAVALGAQGLGLLVRSAPQVPGEGKVQRQDESQRDANPHFPRLPCGFHGHVVEYHTVRFSTILSGAAGWSERRSLVTTMPENIFDFSIACRNWILP